MRGRIFLGDFPALARRLLEELVASARPGPLAPRLVALPSHQLAAHLKKALAGRGGAAAVRFLTLEELAEALAEDALLGQGLLRLPPCGEELLARAALVRSPASRAAAGAARRPGMAAALGQTLEDLREGGLTPSDLDRARSGLRGDLGRKLEELAQLLDDYGRMLREARLYDGADLLREAARRAASSPTLREASLFCLYGFYDM
ncbi:MAG: hypothetical protein ACE5JJ_07715, partial [Nitrospinota bacterium]